MQLLARTGKQQLQLPAKHAIRGMLPSDNAPCFAVPLVYFALVVPLSDAKCSELKLACFFTPNTHYVMRLAPVVVVVSSGTPSGWHFDFLSFYFFAMTPKSECAGVSACWCFSFSFAGAECVRIERVPGRIDNLV